jgi:hypothetical protein
LTAPPHVKDYALGDLKVILNFLAEDLLGEYSDDSLKSLEQRFLKPLQLHLQSSREEGSTF